MAEAFARGESVQLARNSHAHKKRAPKLKSVPRKVPRVENAGVPLEKKVEDYISKMRRACERHKEHVLHRLSAHRCERRGRPRVRADDGKRAQNRFINFPRELGMLIVGS